MEMCCQSSSTFYKKNSKNKKVVLPGTFGAHILYSAYTFVRFCETTWGKLPLSPSTARIATNDSTPVNTVLMSAKL